MSGPLRIDARGMRCPWPALRLARGMREANAVTILADNPAAAGEIAALAVANGWQVVRSDEEFHLYRSDPTIR